MYISQILKGIMAKIAPLKYDLLVQLISLNLSAEHSIFNLEKINQFKTKVTITK